MLCLEKTGQGIQKSAVHAAHAHVVHVVHAAHVVHLTEYVNVLRSYCAGKYLSKTMSNAKKKNDSCHDRCANYCNL